MVSTATVRMCYSTIQWSVSMVSKVVCLRMICLRKFNSAQSMITNINTQTLNLSLVYMEGCVKLAARTRGKKGRAPIYMAHCVRGVVWLRMRNRVRHSGPSIMACRPLPTHRRQADRLLSGAVCFDHALWAARNIFRELPWAYFPSAFFRAVLFSPAQTPGLVLVPLSSIRWCDRV